MQTHENKDLDIKHIAVFFSFLKLTNLSEFKNNFPTLHLRQSVSRHTYFVLGDLFKNVFLYYP